MKVIETTLKDCYVIQPTVFEDDRGFFYEQFNQKQFNDGIKSSVNFVQDNVSESQYGVIRGLHYQTGIYAQAKLVTVLKGKVLDVAVDMRKDSPTFGKHYAIELTENNKTQLFVPKGFAHGFAVLSDKALFSYKCDAYYNKESEAGIHYDDNHLDIDWLISQEDVIISEKDEYLPSFKNAYKF